MVELELISFLNVVSNAFKIWLLINTNACSHLLALSKLTVRLDNGSTPVCGSSLKITIHISTYKQTSA